jgi:LmbE family N-acetylglucosaminyl deacetylase
VQLTSLNDITTQHRHIFLSPHFDDVVYSCGGTLGVQISSGIRPLVITVFGGVPATNLTPSAFAIQANRGMGLDLSKGMHLAVEQRRKEDAAALDYIGADYLWLDYQDAVYRGNPPYYTSEAQLIGGDIHHDDLWIDQELSQTLISLAERLPDAAWYAPLGVGRHVDHQIVCSAADRLIQRNVKVYLYEEFPYVAQKGALAARQHELGLTLEPALVEMSEMLPLRLEASAIYASRTTADFGSKEAMFQTMTDYSHSLRPVETIHLERYWQVR